MSLPSRRRCHRSHPRSRRFRRASVNNGLCLLEVEQRIRRLRRAPRRPTRRSRSRPGSPDHRASTPSRRWTWWTGSRTAWKSFQASRYQSVTRSNSTSRPASGRRSWTSTRNSRSRRGRPPRAVAAAGTHRVRPRRPAQPPGRADHRLHPRRHRRASIADCGALGRRGCILLAHPQRSFR